MGGLGSSSSPTARIALLSVAVVLYITFLAHSVNATCFFPDGTVADSGHKECDPNSSEATTCCAEGFQCLSNGLCNDYRYQNWTRVLRGACTNQDFGGNCNEVCKDYWPMGDEAVWYCGSGKYCCSRENDCCNSTTVEKHDLGAPSVIAIAGKTTPTASISRSSTSSTPTTTTTPPQSASSGSGTNTRTIAIAVGVIAGVLLVLLVGAVWWFRQRRRAKQNRPVMHELSTAGGAAPSIHGDEVRPQFYDEKRGGWVAGTTNKNESKRRKNEETARNGDDNLLYEVQADRVVEMPAQAEAKEMDGLEPEMNGGGYGGKGPHHHPTLSAGEEAGRSSLMEGRRSRFVEDSMVGHNKEVGRSW